MTGDRGITVTVPDEWQALTDVAAFRVRSYLAAMFRELELGAPPALDIAMRDETGIVFGARTVAFELPVRRDATALGEAIALAIYRCRELLVSESLVAALWQTWFPEHTAAGATAMPGELVSLVRTAVRYGLRPGRCRAWFAQTELDAALPARRLAQRIEQLLDEDAAGTIELRLGAELHAAVGAAAPLLGDDRSLGDALALLGDAMYWELGVFVRTPLLVLDSSLDGDACVVRCNELSAPAFHGLAADEFLVNASVEQAAALNPGARIRAVENPVSGDTFTAGYGETAHALYRTLGLTTWGRAGVLILWVSQILRESAGGLVPMSLVRLYLLRLGGTLPALVAEVQRQFSVPQITGVLRALLDEQQSIRDMRGILEALLEIAGTTSLDHMRCIVFPPSSTLAFPSAEPRTTAELEAAALAECTRVARKREVSSRYTRDTPNRLVVQLLSPEIEHLLANPQQASADVEQRICDALRNSVGLRNVARRAVVLTTMNVRRRLADLVRGAFPRIAVLSYSELSADLSIEPIARVLLPPAQGQPEARAPQPVFEPG